MQMNFRNGSQLSITSADDVAPEDGAKGKGKGKNQGGKGKGKKGNTKSDGQPDGEMPEASKPEKPQKNGMIDVYFKLLAQTLDVTRGCAAIMADLTARPVQEGESGTAAFEAMLQNHKDVSFEPKHTGISSANPFPLHLPNQ